jgi:hypothetical protein
MALQEGAVSGRRLDGPQTTPRLRLKRQGSTAGYVDGAWWPLSDDLPAELPDLLTVLSVRLGPVARVIYNLDEWSNVPPSIVSGGHVVRLDGYRRHPAHTIGVLDSRGRRIVLLVLPSRTEPELAHAIAMAAAASDDASTVKSLLKT